MNKRATAGKSGSGLLRAAILSGVLGLALSPASAADETAADQTAANQTNDLVIVSEPALANHGPYSQAVAANGFLFLSGVVATDPASGKIVPGGIDAQTRRVLDSIRAILKAGGATLEDVVKVGIFLKYPSDFAPMNKAYLDYFTAHKPARTTVPGVEWQQGEILIEIDVIARLPQQ